MYFFPEQFLNQSIMLGKVDQNDFLENVCEDRKFNFTFPKLAPNPV